MSTSSSADGGIDETFRANANADQAPSDDNESEDAGQIDLDALAAAFQVKDWETVNASVLATWIHDGKNGLHFYAQVDDGADTDPNRALARQLIVAGLKMLSPDSCVRQDGDDHLQAKEELDSEPPETPKSESAQTTKSSKTTKTDHKPKMAQFSESVVNDAESGHFPHTADPRPSTRYFVPTPQHELPQFACPSSGRRYSTSIHPEGETRTAPTACGKCEYCIGYKKFGKLEQYLASQPSEMATILVAVFPTPDDASVFSGKKAHLNRLNKTRRFTILRQFTEFGHTKPCWVQVIWDGTATEQQIKDAKKRARQSGGKKVKGFVVKVSKEKFLEWLPDHFSLEGKRRKDRKQGRINACRFSNGWTQPLKLPDDWRDGLTRSVGAPRKSEWRPRPRQNLRGLLIRNSWRRNFLADPTAPAVTRALERARYVNAMDWIVRWENLELKHIDATQGFIDAYLLEKNPSVKDWQQKTDGPRPLAVETARWLNGEREPEPAITMVAARLGYIGEGPEPAIDPAFLAELTYTLPPLEFVDEPPRAA